MFMGMGRSQGRTVDSLGDCVDMISTGSTSKFMGAEKATLCSGHSMT